VASVESDTRGIIDPGVFRTLATLNRYPPGPDLEGLIAFFWVVEWHLPDGTLHPQQILSHPCANISISPGQADADGRPTPVEAVLTGVHLDLYTRRLSGSGVAVAARTTTGGLGAFVPGPVSEFNDQVVPLGHAFGVDAEQLIADVADAPDESARVAVLAGCLITVLGRAAPERLAAAREVAGIARLAETDRSLRRLDDLAAAAGIGIRTMQRLFAEHAGVSPTTVLRRYRLLEAAEVVRDGRSVVWAQVASELGYSDQAHLVRDFRAAVGTTPAAYAAQQFGV
jgi:AraC-like DNA-binding protein